MVDGVTGAGVSVEVVGVAGAVVTAAGFTVEDTGVAGALEVDTGALDILGIPKVAS